MTIIRQKKNIDVMQRWIIGLSVCTACTAVAGVLAYNQVVNNAHEITQRRSAVRAVEVKNAELKGVVYELTSARSVEAFAEANGLVVEKNPNFVTRQRLSINL